METHDQYEKKVTDFFGALGRDDFELSHCLFCSPNAPSELLFQKQQMRIVRCSCGLVYNQNQPSSEALDRFYENSQAMSDWSKIKESPHEDLRQREKFQKAVQWITRQKVSSLLDVGCGTGMFLQMIGEADPGILACGIDLNEASLAVARRKKILVKKASLPHLIHPPTTEKFDALSVWGLLEHVKEPLSFLADCRNLLDPSGYLILCVPNVESRVVEVLGEKCFTFCPQHLWYFSRWELKRALDQTGFKLLHSYTIEPEELPVLRVQSGYPPYSREHDPEIEKKCTRKKIAQEILLKNQGYKIVAIAQKQEVLEHAA